MVYAAIGAVSSIYGGLMEIQSIKAQRAWAAVVAFVAFLAIASLIVAVAGAPHDSNPPRPAPTPIWRTP
jgi:hypothetical protein